MRAWVVLPLCLATCGPSLAPGLTHSTRRGAAATREPRIFEGLTFQVANLEVGPPDQLSIGPHGAMRLARTAAVTPAGIGVFETRLRPDEVRHLDRILRGIERLPDHWGRIVPDDRVRRVRVVWSDGTHTEKAVGTEEPVDPRLAPILAHLEALAVRTALHPRETIGLALTSVRLTPEGKLVASAVLSATGTRPVRLPAPQLLATRVGALGLLLINRQREIDGIIEGVARVEVPITEVLGPGLPELQLEPDSPCTLELHATLPMPGFVPDRASLVARFDGDPPPIAGEVATEWIQFGP